MTDNAFPLDVVENFADLGGRAFAMIEKRNKIGNGAFEIDIVFPKGVISVNQKCLRRRGMPAHKNMILRSSWRQKEPQQKRVKTTFAARIRFTMKTRGVVLGIVVLSISFLALAQTRKKAAASKSANQARSAQMHVVPDLKQRLARFRQVHLPFSSTALTAPEQKMISKLVDACRYVDDIYWRQIDPDALQLDQSLAGSTNPNDIDLRRYLWINGSRFDLLHGDEPFVGTSPMPQGRGFYPQGLTRDQVEQYAKQHPEQKSEIYSSTTILRSQGNPLNGGSLVAIPYHIAYRAFLQ